MLKDARALASYTQEKMLAQPDVWREDVVAEMKTYAIGSNSDYLLCGDDGYVVAATSGDVEDIDPELLQKFDGNTTYSYDDLKGALKEVCHITGDSFTANGPRYYVLAYSPKSEQDNYTKNIMEIFMISAIAVLLVVMFLVYFATLKLTAPITEVADIAKKLGSGDFSVTLPEYTTKEFNELSIAFNEMAANLKSYDTMRNSFLANVSHELRTPMTSIGGFVDGLLDGTIPKAHRG